jgi:hypothetical protein
MDTKANRARRAEPPSRRLPVPLSERDERDLDLIRNSPAALERVGAKADDSDASLVHALMQAGARQATEAAEEASYAAYADWIRTDPEEVAIRSALRGRRLDHEEPDA